MPKTKGHWPRGKRRNDPGVTKRELRRTMRQVKRLIETTQLHGPSYNKLAEFVGVNQRSVRRWIDGEDWPDRSEYKAVVKWLERNK